jgi:hypothetical protein
MSVVLAFIRNSALAGAHTPGFCLGMIDKPFFRRAVGHTFETIG